MVRGASLALLEDLEAGWVMVVGNVVGTAFYADSASAPGGG